MPSPRQRAHDVAIAKAFGQRVRDTRQAAGMTQERLAEAAGLHPTFISNIERGYRVPTVPTLLRLAKGLNVTPSTLINHIQV